MSEQEAKTKWCPFARTLDWEPATIRHGDDPVPVSAAVNREPGEYDKAGNETVVITGRHRCIGSACMAWRWEPVPPRYDGTSLILESPAPKPTDGFCGLAGRPS